LAKNGLINFIGLGFVSLIGFISLLGHIGLVGHIGHNSLASIISPSLVSLVGLSLFWPFNLATHRVAIKLPSITGITKVIKQAAHGVATVSSATKITNAAIWYYCTASHLFVRESWLWHVLCRLDSFFFGDTLQNTKQVFSVRLLQMTKYCIMRECENIFHGYLYV
jgi:hypothetical protein